MASEVTLTSKEWQSFFKNATYITSNFGKYLMAAANIFGFKDIIEHFEDEKGPDGNWPKRSANTNRAYDILGGSYSSSNKLLQLTGRLRGSFMPGSSYIKQNDRLSVTLFSDPTLDYARVHDEGSDSMPKREFMWLSDKAKQLILTMLIDQIVTEDTSLGGAI